MLIEDPKKRISWNNLFGYEKYFNFGINDDNEALVIFQKLDYN